LNLNKCLPLSETTYYILLSLLKPNHGYAIMQNVEALSGGKVKIAAGTLYGAIENLLKQNMIVQVGSYDSRRKVYALTLTGKEVLNLEYQRMKHLIEISDGLFIQSL
jgi:DNA-binding PadR family transcriptional regulator